MLFNSIEFFDFFPYCGTDLLFDTGESPIYLAFGGKLLFLYVLGCEVCTAIAPVYMYYLRQRLFLQHIKDNVTDAVEQKRKMKICVAASFTLNLGILFYFKYFNFTVGTMNRVLTSFNSSVSIPMRDIVLPVGISFYIFQALSYTMDVYRGEVKAEKNFLKYALFVSFFPQLVAGPIERSKRLLKQINEEHKFEYENFVDGVYLMLWGYFLKLVLADRIALFVDRVYGDISQFGGVYLIAATMLFAVQIYCDFAGYSTIAMGAAKIMGFRLMENFDAPYLAQSVAEFWRRWHISLTSWFRDYLYIPLGGNKKGNVRKYINILIVFAVSGLWHGAEWTFVIWGVLNAAYQICGSLSEKFRKQAALSLGLHRDSIAGKILRTVITFVLVDFAWIFFRAENLTQALEIIRSMLSVHNWWVLFDDSLTALVVSRKNFEVMMLGIALLFGVDIAKRKGICVRELIRKQDFWFRYLVIVLAVGIILTLGIWGPGYDAGSFIYFQF